MKHQEILNCLKNQFSFPESPLMGQVATISDTGPAIRTMRMYEITEEGHLIFLSHRSSHKWLQLCKHPHVAVCFLSTSMSTQILAKGSVSLQTENLQSYWEKTRYDVRKIYDHYDVEGPYTSCEDLTPPEKYPKEFGQILVKPHEWEILELSAEYTQSKRMRYQLEGDKWLSERVNVS